MPIWPWSTPAPPDPPPSHLRTLLSTHSPTLTLTALILSSTYLLLRLRRIRSADAIPASYFHRRSLRGVVTSVGDGDGFRLFHTPGGRLAGWGWLRKIPEPGTRGVKDTVPVRLAGVDAPEGAHFGRIAQPGSVQALEWLKEKLLGKRVKVDVYRRDQYGRVVGSVRVRRGWRWKDVGTEMLESGWAVVYEAKTGAEFGKLEEAYRLAELRAKKARRGVWRQKRIDFVSPGDYKRAIKDGEAKGSAASPVVKVKV